MKLLYFTATGNSLYAAKKIGGELISIPQAVKFGNYNFSDDKIGLIFPVYFVLLPALVEDFLRKVKLQGDYIFAVLTYGMMAGNAAGYLLKAGKERGIDFSYINTLKMVDNYIPDFRMEDQIRTEPDKRIDLRLGAINSDIRNAKRLIPTDSFSGRIMTAVIRKLFKPGIGPGAAKKFLIEESCNGCETCVKVCVLKNIGMQNHKPVFGIRCMSCMACTQNCPQNSIRIKNEKSRARFRNRNVALKEIIDANRQ